MGYWVGDLYSSRPVRRDYKIAATLAEGVMVLRHTTAANAGEVVTSTTNATQAVIGVTTEAATYTTTQAADMTEGVVGVIDAPFAIFRYMASGGTTEGTALATGTNIVSNDTAETAGTIITEAGITTDFSGGLLKGRTGANIGQTRVVTVYNSGTNVGVTVPFPNDIGVDDTFVLMPWSRKIANLTFTTALTEADASVATGTAAAELTVHNVIIDEENSRAWVDVVARDHWYNAETA